ncbi:hypothetical protein PENTCL1PPCAC_17705, partial [Pristionchus entomophagus]
EQRCLVCDSLTKHAHLAVLICRACKIFYRRSEKRKRPLVCRSNKGKCKKAPRCKKCRYDQIDRLVTGISDWEGEEKSGDCSEEPSTSSSEEINPDIARLLCTESLDKQLHLLEQIRFSYRTMSLSRRAAELIEFHPGRHPICAFSHQHPIKPATITSLNYSMRLLVSALFEFATTVFEEFSDLSLQNKWYLIKNFHHPFWTLESAYRVLTQFPHLHNFHFMSLTTYLNDTSAASFMNLAPRTPRAKNDARDLLRCFLRYDTRMGQNAVRKADISEEEFLALLVLTFWNIENTTADDSLISLGIRYRGKVMGELQELYRRNGTEEDCARRIGELMGIVVVLQDLSFIMPMNLEMFRLLNVFDDNTTMYQLTKSGVPESRMEREREEVE